jgi:hypothetical protein
MKTIRFKSHDTILKVAVDDKDTLNFMNFLESCKCVESYKFNCSGLLTEAQLQYSYPGYYHPAGKLISLETPFFS